MVKNEIPGPLQKLTLPLSDFLTRILPQIDENWYQISPKCNPSLDDRHHKKEVKTIRNRWAHSNAEGFPSDDIYRDLDTLQRFAGVINPDDSLVQEIQAAKKALLAPKIPSSAPDETVSPEPPQEKPEALLTEFAPGQVVSLKSNAEIRGAMLAVLPRPSLNRPQPNGLRILRQNGNNTSLLSIIWGFCRHPPELLILNMRASLMFKIRRSRS